MNASGVTQVLVGTQVLDPPPCFPELMRNMSKVLGEKIGIDQLDLVRSFRFPKYLGQKVVGYDFTQVLGSEGSWVRFDLVRAKRARKKMGF